MTATLLHVVRNSECEVVLYGCWFSGHTGFFPRSNVSLIHVTTQACDHNKLSNTHTAEKRTQDRNRSGRARKREKVNQSLFERQKSKLVVERVYPSGVHSLLLLLLIIEFDAVPAHSSVILLTAVVSQLHTLFAERL